MCKTIFGQKPCTEDKISITLIHMTEISETLSFSWIRVERFKVKEALSHIFSLTVRTGLILESRPVYLMKMHTRFPEQTHLYPE